MKLRGSYKPSKATSVISVVMGGIFIYLGIDLLVPLIAIIGWLWTAMAIMITGYHLINIFSPNGVAESHFDIEQSNLNSQSNNLGNSINHRLDKLEKLLVNNTITLDEYKKQRKRILSET
jgi:hypothetical protein